MKRGASFVRYTLLPMMPLRFPQLLVVSRSATPHNIGRSYPITIPSTTPLLYIPSVLLLAHVMVFAIVGYMPSAHRNVALYFTPALCEAMSKLNPATASKGTTML